MNQNNPFNKLAKGSYFLILDNFANLGIGAIFWLIVAKMTEPTIIGQAMVITGLALTVIGFTGYGIQTGLSKYLSEYNAKNMPNMARRILRNGIRGSLLISGILAIIVSLFAGQIATLAYSDPTLALLLIFTLVTFIPTQTFTSALLGAFQGMHIAKFVTITDSIFQVSRMAFVVIALIYGLGVFGILLGFTLASFVSLAICYLFLLPRAFPKSTEEDGTLEEVGMRHVFKFMSLNYVTVGFKVLSHQLGILMLGTLSFEWAAFYGLALLISKIVASFSNSVGHALLPTASEHLVKGDKTQLGKMVNTAVRISILISGFGFIVLMIDPMSFLSLISDSYIEAAWALRILAISAIMVSITAILTSLLNAMNRAMDVAKIGMASSVTTIVLTFVLIPIGGLEGAAMAVFAGSALGLGLSLIALKQKENMVISSRSIVKPFTAIITGLVVGYLFVIWNNILLGFILGIACYVMFAIAYRATTRHEIIQLINIVAKKKDA